MNRRIGILVGIVILGGILRFWQLGVNPPALSWDEVAWGYNAYSILLDGKDEFGRSLPLDFLESFGDFKPPLYAYLTVIPVKIFGLNEFSTRFASAFWGTLTVLMTYFLVMNLFSEKNTRRLALVSAFLLAISPWHIMLSRAAFEANVACFLIVSGVTFFLISLKHPWIFILSGLAFALSLTTFNTARIVTPILVGILGVSNYKHIGKFKKQVMVAFILSLVILIPTIRFLLTPQASLRFREVNIFSDSEIVIRSNQQIANDNNAWWSKIIHNRRWEYAREYLRHFGDNLNPAFLFIRGDGNPKFSTQDVGQLYLWEAPFLVLGLIVLIKQKTKYWWLIPVWLLVGIIPAASARETPHALRIESTLPTWQILVGLGVVTFYNGLQKTKIKIWGLALLVIMIIFNFAYYQHSYWRHYAKEYGHEWQYDYKPTLEYIKQNQSQYRKVWYTDTLGRPYIYFLYYLKISPEEFRQTAVVSREVFGFVNVDEIGKYNFFREKNPPQLLEKELYVGNKDYIPNNARILADFGRLVAYTK